MKRTAKGPRVALGLEPTVGRGRNRVGGMRSADEEWTVRRQRRWPGGGGEGRGHPRDYSDFKGLVFGICRRHKRTATLNWMSFGFIDFTITATTVVPRVLFAANARSLPSPRTGVPGPFGSVRVSLLSLARATSGRPVKFPKVHRGTLSFT